MDNIVAACAVAILSLVFSLVVLVVSQLDHMRLKLKVSELENENYANFRKIEGLTHQISEIAEIGSTMIEVMVDYITNHESK